ncbi:hypothetical protein BcDW1_6182 [Botrytis cinerea BcDW1]|nr:hypothetical protein BcDW1_6182 [Botrytis cinerea BcDW1]
MRSVFNMQIIFGVDDTQTVVQHSHWPRVFILLLSTPNLKDHINMSVNLSPQTSSIVSVRGSRKPIGPVKGGAKTPQFIPISMPMLFKPTNPPIVAAGTNYFLGYAVLSTIICNLQLRNYMGNIQQLNYATVLLTADAVTPATAAATHLLAIFKNNTMRALTLISPISKALDEAES